MLLFESEFKILLVSLRAKTSLIIAVKQQKIPNND